MIDYNKRLVEVDEILNYLSKQCLLKIPKDIRNTIKENMDKQYIWKYDETKKLKDQNLNRDTIIILSYLNMEYLLNEKQKKYMLQLHELNQKKSEESKLEKYSADNLFKNKKQEEINKTEKFKEKALIENKEESVFIKILNKIKNLFKRR